MHQTQQHPSLCGCPPALCFRVPALRRRQDHRGIAPERAFKYPCFAQSPRWVRALPGNASRCPLPCLPAALSASHLLFLPGSASGSSRGEEHNATTSTPSLQKRYYLHSHLPPRLPPSSLLSQRVFPLLQLTLDEAEHPPSLQPSPRRRSQSKLFRGGGVVVVVEIK